MGIPLPSGAVWVPSYTASDRLIASSHPSDYKHNDGDDDPYQNKGGIKSCAENVTNYFATCYCEEHQNDDQCI